MSEVESLLPRCQRSRKSFITRWAVSHTTGFPPRYYHKPETSKFQLNGVFIFPGGVPARPLPRAQDAGQAPHRQQEDQHDQVAN